MLPGISKVLLNAESAQDASGAAKVGKWGLLKTSHYIRWDEVTTGGEVTIETASSPTFSGTWVPLKVVAWSGANREDLIHIEGSYRAIRHRVSSPILNGAVTTKVVGSV